MRDIEAFEKLWAVRGHAEAVVATIKLDGVSDTKLKILDKTIERMLALIKECMEYRKL